MTSRQTVASPPGMFVHIQEPEGVGNAECALNASDLRTPSAIAGLCTDTRPWLIQVRALERASRGIVPYGIHHTAYLSEKP